MKEEKWIHKILFPESPQKQRKHKNIKREREGVVDLPFQFGFINSRSKNIFW